MSVTGIEGIPGSIIEPYNDVEEWLAARAGSSQPYIGASESPAILNCGYADESPYTAWARKLGKMPPIIDSEALECGRFLQPSIIALFARRFARECPDRVPKNFRVNSLGEFTICRSEKYPFVGCTLDGLFTMEMEDGWALVEAKNVSVFMGRWWREQATVEYVDEEQAFDWDVTEERLPKPSEIDIPLKFQVQAQHQMATNPKFVRCFVVGLIGGNKLVWKEVERDEEFIDILIPELEKFHRLVITETAPPIDGSRATARAIAAMHPDDDGRTIVLPPIADEWHQEYQSAKLAIKQANERRMLYRNLLANEVGPATYGMLVDGTRYSFKTSERPEKTYTRKASKFRVLRHGK